MRVCEGATALVLKLEPKEPDLRGRQPLRRCPPRTPHSQACARQVGPGPAWTFSSTPWSEMQPVSCLIYLLKKSPKLAQHPVCGPCVVADVVVVVVVVTVAAAILVVEVSGSS